ncbi:hypothetical protein LAZ67_8000300 [Cordylochernes scorpioides]|uniref:Uncharacterized protein n=1 Tax=Cordylochernes scorpioides TaxID=51811 RepID=A0ABY6KSW9_9ARAC|nr:hypothetical protein LAZ67_8000300 [Cordylochernes scorpioides]
MWSLFAQRLTQITSPAATPDQLWQRVEAAWSAIPQEHIQTTKRNTMESNGPKESLNGSLKGRNSGPSMSAQSDSGNADKPKFAQISLSNCKENKGGYVNKTSKVTNAEKNLTKCGFASEV